jgi:ribosomal protein L7/L12
MNNRKLPDSTAPELSAAVRLALMQGNKIEAIKLLREEQNLGLKEAKDLVDGYVASQPALHAQLAAAQTASLRKGLVWLGALGLLFVLGYFLWAR